MKFIKIQKFIANLGYCSRRKAETLIKQNRVSLQNSKFNAYYLNNKFVFKKTKNFSLIPLIKTFLCYGSTFILSFILTKILTEWFNLSVFFVPILSIFITTPLNFLINKFWSFA